MDLVDTLVYPSPILVWGLFSRGLGLVFLVSFASLSFQVVPMAGRRGIAPVREVLEAMKRDFTPWRRYAYFPTLLWFNASDAMLRALTWAGLVASASIIVGGAHAPWAFAVCYLCYLSLDRAANLVYPWDCLLVEAGFWAMFLPATFVLPRIGVEEAPLPAVAWVFRLAVFRLMFGFGKNKFLGATSRDSGYLKGFFVNQPLPSPIGWFSHHMPMALHKLALAIMFLVEVPIPFTVFFPGPWSTLGALSTMGLMLAIWINGNFGFFNLLAIVVTLSWMDNVTAASFSFSDFFSADSHVFVHALVFLHMVCAILSLPFNTWSAHTWTLWPMWLRGRPRPFMWPLYVVRALHPLRWLHSYGVFPPRSPPPVKTLPVIEVSWDEKEWHTLSHRYSPTLESSPPKFIAPHHPRLDQAVVYEGVGLNESSILRNFYGRWDPYGHGTLSAGLQLMKRVLEGNVPGGELFYDRSLERQKGRPPAVVRARTFMFEPTGFSELRRTGKWWKRTMVGPHLPPMKVDDPSWNEPLAPPELWHFEDVIWQRRSRLGPLMERVRRGDSAHELVLAGADDVTSSDVDLLWNEFLPDTCSEGRHDWRGIRARVEALRARYGRRKLYRFQRLVGRYGVFLMTKLEPLFLDKGQLAIWGLAVSKLDVKTHYHLRLLCDHIIGEGREVYDAVLADPMKAVAYVEQMTLQSGAFFLAIFRYETLVYHSRKCRLLSACTEHDGWPEPTAEERRRVERIGFVVKRSWGGLDMVEFLKTQFKDEEDVRDVPEAYCRFVLEATGEVRKIPSV